MQTTKKQINETKVELAIVADAKQLATLKQSVLERLKSNVKVTGFREGKAPITLIEKQIEPSLLQSEFLDEAINEFYSQAVTERKLRLVSQPKITVAKFVPFTTLEFNAELEVVGDIKLPDYTKIRLAKKPVTVTAKDVNDVIARLRTREAEKKEAKRPVKNGDEVTIDFTGVDAKTKEPISGADGKAYPLVLGSNTFIPGFEPELVGLKTGDQKKFIVTFPSDYGVQALQNRKVEFTVTAKKIQELIEPELDDKFVAKIGPFKTVAELKTDIKKQLTVERQQQAQRELESDLITKIAEQATVAIPDVLIEEQLDRLEQDERQNLAYRGQTWQEHLAEEGVDEAGHRAKHKDAAELRVKAGLVISEIAELEKLTVTPEEFEVHIQVLKDQYPDAQMQAELDKPENRRDVLSRILTEKTITKLVAYATAN